MRIRDATPDDVPALVDLVTALSPRNEPWLATMPFADTVSASRSRLALEAGGALGRDGDGHGTGDARRADRVVGFAWSLHRKGSPEHQGHVSCWVIPEHRGRGLGGRLLADCLDGLGDGVTEVWTRCYDDDPRTLAVLRHWGFDTVQRSITSRIRLEGDAAAAPVLPADVTAEVVDDLDPPDTDAFEAMLSASQTNPEATSSHRSTAEEMRHWVDPGETPVASLLRVHGAPAAIAFAVVDLQRHNGGVGYTGVDPRFRGRGLGALAKRVLHHRAAALGVRELITDNEEHNTGIRRVNAALGYVVDHGQYRLRRRT